ncbi:DoxX family membrane protein [Acidisoma cellulosilytica]|uniref:DoxX family membrane protein n=1 Tax=Acidisoma cellulosilyticum TaxID=2802395 RepID=A0A964E6K4_9PROT|nr:DoxX family membrane protein [Acidisoma cellulosilyticum]MCB8883679.1 DoxX family membrane protein [Acidisoma cellulosilyticum]
MTSQVVAAFAIRCLLVVLFFPFSALDKTLNFGGAVGQAQQVFKARPVAVAMIFTGLAVEALMPLGIITGTADRLAAFILAGYCIVTALLFKQFWTPGDFWAHGESKGRDLFWDFLKNFALAGGFLLITVGLNGGGLHAFISNPTASTHPYAMH